MKSWSQIRTAQFAACFENLRMVLAEAGCTFDDIVDITTYHVDMDGALGPHSARSRTAMLPRGKFPWTAVGVTALAEPALLLEVKATACCRA